MMIYKLNESFYELTQDIRYFALTGVNLSRRGQD